MPGHVDVPDEGAHPVEHLDPICLPVADIHQAVVGEPKTVRQRGEVPFGLGTVGLVIALVGKFALASTPLLYVGLASLVGASLWNSWPRKRAGSVSRTICAPQGAPTTTTEGGHPHGGKA